MDTIGHSTTSRRYFQKFEFQSIYDTWLFESKLSNSLDSDEIPGTLDFPDVYIPPRNLEYWRVRHFSNRPTNFEASIRFSTVWRY